MELVFDDKLKVIRPTYCGSRHGGTKNILTDVIFVKLCLNALYFHYRLPDTEPKVLEVLSLTSIVTVNTKPYK